MNRNINRRQSLMVHAPSIGAITVNGTMDDALVRGLLRLRGTEGEAKYTGQIQPIEADNEIGFFDQRGRGFVRAQARRGQMEWVRRRKRCRIIAAGQYGGADRFGKV